MSEVNNTITPPVHKRPRGKKKLSADRRRVILSVRVLPSTMSYLEGMGYGTIGRALDVLVKSVQHPGVMSMLENKADFSIVNLAG